MLKPPYIKHFSGPTPSTSGQQRPRSPRSRDESNRTSRDGGRGRVRDTAELSTLDEIRLEQAKSDLRVNWLIEEQKQVDLEKSKLEVRATTKSIYILRVNSIVPTVIIAEAQSAAGGNRDPQRPPTLSHLSSCPIATRHTSPSP